MPWKQGQSGNPKGSPPKSRQLTAILEQAGSKTVEYDGKRVSGKHLVATLLWQAATRAEATLPNGEVLRFSPQDWFAVVKHLYGQIDGPPRQDVDITTAGEPLVFTFNIETNDDGDITDV